MRSDLDWGWPGSSHMYNRCKIEKIYISMPKL